MMVLGVVFVALVGLFVALLIWAHKAGADAQEKFYAAMESGDSEKMMDLLSPTLRTQVDPPVMAAFMRLFESKLGKYQGLRSTDFHSSSKYVNGVSRLESVGIVDFEKGEANSEVIYFDGKLAGFHISSPLLPENWFEGPTTTVLYRDEGKTFLQELLNGDDAAVTVLLPEMQKKSSFGELKKKSEAMIADAGMLKSVDFQSEKADVTDGYRLTATYALHFDRKDLTAKVDFRFSGLKGGV
ncbi:MAG TPA: hypothetical protein VKB78_06195, partial [Pirellulales bacterium]|nr:hypothetical protein [Pirellulales bacterium]